ncbi:hypothetical protein BSN85_17965 [Bradyrhizobium brasilense]|nr:hypothetical protein BSN85_17965 [Bradyrhizobium brasilense]
MRDDNTGFDTLFVRCIRSAAAWEDFGASDLRDAWHLAWQSPASERMPIRPIDVLIFCHASRPYSALGQMQSA